MSESHPLRGKVPSRRLTKEELARTHRSHLKKQDLTPNAPRPVKQPLLDQAYPASIRSIRDLEIVSQDMNALFTSQHIYSSFRLMSLTDTLCSDSIE